MMSKRIGESRETSGQGSSHSSVEDSDASLHVVGRVFVHKEEPKIDRLTAFLQAQKQGFECEDTDKPEDDTEDLKAKNQKRVDEMLQKAQEELRKRKEKCSEEDINKNKEVMVPDNKQHHHGNVLEVLHKMVWLQNQNICAELGRSCRTENANKNIEEETMQSLPRKQQDSEEYFTATKQSKSKGRRKNRPETLISMEDLEKPLLEAAVEQKYVQSHEKPSHASGQREHVHQTSPPPELTCWQRKSGAHLFPDVPLRTLTVYGAKETEDELLKLAIKESLKTHEAEKQFIDLTEADCQDPPCLKPNNSVGIVHFPLPEPVEDESWDPPENMEQVGGLCLLEKIMPTVSGQMQEILANRTDHQDKEMGAKKPQLSKQSGDVTMGKQKTGVSRKCGKTKGRYRNVSDRWKSSSSNKECDISTGVVRQPRSEHRVDSDTNKNGGNLNRFIKGECKEGKWGPSENGEACNRQQKDDQRGNKKQDQKWKRPVPEPHRNKGENKSETYLPEAQIQVEWNQKEGPVEVQRGDQDQNLLQPAPHAHRNRREIVSQTYMPEASDRGTLVQADWNQKDGQTEVQKDDRDQNLLQSVPHAHRDRREIMSQGYIPEASVNRAQVHVDWNLEKSVAESWKVCSDLIPISLDVVRGRSQEGNRGQEDHDSKSQNYINRNLVYCSHEKLMTEKDNEWNGKKRQGDIWVSSVSQDADICRTEETSSFGGEERLNKPEKGMIERFPGKKSEDSGMCVFTNYDNKVQSDLGKCTNKIESSPDVNHNSYLQVPAEQFFSFNPVSMQNSPEDVQMLSASCIHDAYLHQTHNSCVDSSGSVSQVHHAANSFWPPMTSTAGIFHGNDSLPRMVCIGNQPHAQQIPNRAFESHSQPLPASDIQELFDAFVQEQHQRLMSMNHMVQTALRNPTGLPHPQPSLKLQAQQMNSVPMMAPTNLPRGLPANYNNLLLQSDNVLSNPPIALLHPSLLRMNGVVAPSNVPLQSAVSSSCNRNGNAVQVPNSNMYNSSGTMSPDASAFMINHGTQPNHTPSISPLGISPNYMMPQNYQSSQTYQAAVGGVQNMQYVAPGMHSQPLGVRPTDVVTASKMVIGKGRGRLLP